MKNAKILVIATVFLWSFGSLLTRLISIKSQLLSLNLLFFFTFLVFFGYSFYQYRRKFFSKLRNTNYAYLFFGLFGYFFYYLGLVQSFHLFNNGSETTILNYTFPLFTVLFAELLFGRKRKSLGVVKIVEYIGVFIGFFGIVILATHGNVTTFQIHNTPAVLWGLSAGISYGIFSVYSGTVPKKDEDMFLLLSIFSSWILALFISIPELSSLKTLTFKDYAVTFLLAFIVNGLGYITWSRANRIAKEQHISISSIASILYVLPILAIVIISVFLGERQIFQGYFLFSLVCILISSILCQKADFFFSIVRRVKHE